MNSAKELFPLRYLVFPILIILYAMAINPYLAPSTYDDVVYWEGAKSLVNEGNYVVNGDYIVNTPPGVSLLLAIPLTFGFTSVAVGKITIMLCMAISMFLVWKILETENYPDYLLSIFFFVLAPSSFLLGIRIMSEWPYVMWTMLFFYLLKNLHKSFFFVFAAGFVLALATLTRYVGFTLYFPLVFLAFKNHPWRLILRSREFIVALIGISLCSCSWFLYIYDFNIVEKSVYYRGLSNFNNANLFVLFHMISELFLGSIAYNYIPLPLKFVCDFVIIVPMLVGWGKLIKSRKITYLDVYVVINLGIVCFYTLAKDHRFLIPIAPFLLSYFFYGVEILGTKMLPPLYYQNIRKLGLTFLTALFLILDFTIVFYGNGVTYGAAFYPISNTPEKYYIGFWRELYLACQAIRNTHIDGKILFENAGETRYVYYFSRHLTILKKEESPSAFILLKKKAVKGLYWYERGYAIEKVEIPSNYHLIWKGEYIDVYQHG